MADGDDNGTADDPTIQLFDTKSDFCRFRVETNDSIVALFREDNQLDQDDCDYLLWHVFSQSLQQLDQLNF